LHSSSIQGSQVARAEGSMINRRKTYAIMYVHLLAYVGLCRHDDYANSIMLTMLT